MVKRKIIRIDETLCNGCGKCITACSEGAIELQDGKARVVSDRFCDGLGACLSACPKGALTIEEREAQKFDEAAATKHRKDDLMPMCTAAMHLHSPLRGREPTSGSQLSNWPIQMRLARPGAPYFKGASLLIAADCTGFAYPAIQGDFIRSRVALIGCPKLDDREDFADRLQQILQSNDIKDITVLQMSVPCCAQLEGLVASAINASGKRIPLEIRTVEKTGEMRRE